MDPTHDKHDKAKYGYGAFDYKVQVHFVWQELLQGRNSNKMGPDGQAGLDDLVKARTIKRAAWDINHYYEKGSELPKKVAAALTICERITTQGADNCPYK